MHVIAIDVGTSVVKAILFDQAGCVVSQAAAPSPRPGVDGEVDPGAVWQVVCGVLSEIAGASGELAGVVVTGQGDGLWRMDADGNPLASYQWNSTCSAAVIREWEDRGVIEEHFRASGTVLWPGTSAALWVWLRERDPREAARTATFFTVKDWVSYKLTGRVATDVTDATIPFLDPATGEYSPSAFERLGCGDLQALAAPVLTPGERLGEIEAAAAEATGLAAGTPVFVGCLDGAAMLFGLGLDRVGDCMAILGTTVATAAVTDQLPLAEEASGALLRLGQDRYYRIMAANSGTTTLEWFLDTYGYTGADKYDRYWSDFAASDGDLLMLPYLAGERAPFLEPDATGSFIGITPKTQLVDFARATVEGISFALRLGLEVVGPTTGPLLLTGGGAKCDEWCQLVADVTGRAVVVDDAGDSSLRGVASLVPGFAGLAGQHQERRSTYEPGPEVEALAAKYQRFISTLHAFRALWKKVGEK